MYSELQDRLEEVRLKADFGSTNPHAGGFVLIRGPLFFC